MAWYDESVFYHIYPLGMLGAEKENDYGKVTHRLPELINYIPYLKEMGFNAIYIGPLFESVGHGYETTDYRKLDCRLGDNADLKAYVKACHETGIRVIFDGVFNHVGRDFFAFKDLKENRENSRYRDWFCNVNFWNNNEYNDGFSYDNWGGYNLLVKLNQRNPEVKDYILDVIRFWVSEFDVDGIRLDAADVLDFDFMKALRGLADVVKPDFWLMGEVIHGDYSRWVNNGTLHSVTNYTLHKGMYSGHNDHNYFEIAHTIKRLEDMGLNKSGGFKLYNFVDNHDVERIYTKLSNKANFFPVHVLLFGLAGIPSVYYGSEMGIEGKKEKGSDASLRPSISLETCQNALENNECARLVKRLANIRNSSSVLAYGDYNQVVLTNRQFAFTRNTADQTALVVVNNDENPARVNGGNVRDGEYIGQIFGQKLTVSGGGFSVELQANSGEIFLMAGANSKVDAFEAIAAFEPAKVPVEKDSIEKAASDKETEDKKTEDKKTEDKAASAIDNKVVADTKETAKEESAKEESAKEESAKEVSAEKSEQLLGSASEKYGLEAKYGDIMCESIAARSDFDAMSVEELQVAILEKMSKNGPVNDQMIKTVMDNVYPDSLKNWVKSFR